MDSRSTLWNYEKKIFFFLIVLWLSFLWGNLLNINSNIVHLLIPFFSAFIFFPAFSRFFHHCLKDTSLLFFSFSISVHVYMLRTKEKLWVFLAYLLKLSSIVTYYFLHYECKWPVLCMCLLTLSSTTFNIPFFVWFSLLLWNMKHNSILVRYERKSLHVRVICLYKISRPNFIWIYM